MPSKVKVYTSSSAVPPSGSLFFFPEKTSVRIIQMTTAMSISMPRILKNNSKLFQLTRRSMPTIRRTAAIKIRGVEAFEAANFLNAAENPDSSGWGAVVLLDVPRELFERAEVLWGLLFEPLEEEPAERDLPVFAIFN